MQKLLFALVALMSVSAHFVHAEGWQLVTDVDELSDGDVVTFVNKEYGMVVSNEDNGNYMLSMAAEIGESGLTDSEKILRFTLGTHEGRWTFKTLNYNGVQGYIGNSQNSALCQIKEAVEPGWSASIIIDKDNGDADIVFDNPATKNGVPVYCWLRYSKSSNRFSCYPETELNTYIVQIYKWKTDVTEPVTEPRSYVTTNAIEFSTDIENAEFEIAVSLDDENAPEAFTHLDVDFVNINDIKKLASEQGLGTFYVWARTVIDDGLNHSNAVVVYSFTIDNDYVADEDGIEYKKVLSNDAVVDNNWYIVVAEVDGRCYAMGPDGVGSAVTIRNDEIVAYASMFNGNITEFTYSDGRLNNVTDNQGLSRAVENSIDVVDGQATIVMNGLTLGFDADTNMFSTAASNTDLMLFTTGSERNTGIVSLTDEDNNDEIEYYNMQGVRVLPQIGGLYIVRRGNVITKVLMK